MLPALNQTWALNLNVETGSYILEEEVIGRDQDRDYIVKLLLDSSKSGSESGLCVVPIVGMGGLGKTTLAQYVYNDERMKTHFEVRLWVSATQVFNIRLVLEKIIACATNREKPQNFEMDQLQCSLLHEIRGERFLLVVDNVWDHDCLGQQWEDLRRLLVVGATGSQVLVTTRSETVARVTGTDIVPYRLRELGKDDSWHLFRRFAFRGQGPVDPDIKGIGKEIARRCGNVPLVLQTIGSLLAEKGTIQEWKAFRDDEFANLASYGRGIMQTLKLSYDQLDPKLKLCFAYCSLLGKGHYFRKHEMVHMWIALGYIKPRYKNQSLEDAGEEYVMSLLDRGCFYHARKDEFGRINEFQMHDLMHDLVLSIAQFKYQRVDCNKSYEFDERVRHVSSLALDAHIINLSSTPSKCKRLQSLILTQGSSNWDKARFRIKLASRFPNLRVLHLSGLDVREVPSSICRLIHLRYLDLSDNNHLQRLPNSITNMVNLLSLNLYYCYELRELPKGMSKLVNLRHLNLECCDRLTHMPLGLGKLTDLRTLWRFVAVAGGGGLSELNHLNNLEGSLEIQVGGQSKEEAMAANMKGKEKLRTLWIIFNKGRGGSDEKVLEALQPHPNVTDMTITGYAGERLPRWMREDQLVSSLPNLVYVRILSLSGCKYLCSFGRLPHLKRLYLKGLKDLEYIEEEYGMLVGEGDPAAATPPILFPCLEVLGLENMPKFKGWWPPPLPSALPPAAAAVVCPRLQHVIISNVETLIAMPREFIRQFSGSIQFCIPAARYGLKVKEQISRLGEGFRGGAPSLRCLEFRTYSYIPERGVLWPSTTAFWQQQSHQPEPEPVLLNSHLLLPNLRELTFWGLVELEELPEEFKHLSCLESLAIWSCECFKALPEWIDSLTSLTSLSIFNCPKLTSLPKQISNLANLERLRIIGCRPTLAERCRKPTGEDWSLIQHIPDIHIEPRG